MFYDPNALQSNTFPLTASTMVNQQAGIWCQRQQRAMEGFWAGGWHYEKNTVEVQRWQRLLLSLREKELTSVPSLSSHIPCPLWLPSSPEVRIHKAEPLTLSRSDIKHHSFHCHVDGLILLESRREAVGGNPGAPLLQPKLVTSLLTTGCADSGGWRYKAAFPELVLSKLVPIRSLPLPAQCHVHSQTLDKTIIIPFCEKKKNPRDWSESA